MNYELRESARARHLRVTVHADGRVILTKPARLSQAAAERFLAARSAWIEQTLERLRSAAERSERKLGKAILLPKLRRGTKAYKEAIEEARKAVTARVEALAKRGGYAYSSIAIRNQSTRWGSCSARGALSFNYRLIYLPAELLDYLVAHELAHTKHQNHSPRFWEEVGKQVPDWKEKRRELRRHRF